MTDEPLWLYVTRRIIRSLLYVLFGFVTGVGYTSNYYQSLERVEEVRDTCTPQLFEDHCGCLEDSLIQEIEQ